MAKYIMALDAGTSSCRAIIFDDKGQALVSAQSEISRIHPQPGWVEQDPTEIWSSQLGVAVEALNKLNLRAADIAAIGITNQRETTIVWDKKTGLPLYNAIVWQCRRTSDYINQLEAAGYKDTIYKKTGLILDPYFSASKLTWLLDNVEGLREKAEAGKVLFGTVDTWLMWKLTRGQVHATDYSNASRTMLYNIQDLEWDDELLEIFGVPKAMLPEVRSSDALFGKTDQSFFGEAIPIHAVLGDQQAALFGQACFEPGDAKNTYGTGCFLLMNTGDKPVYSKNGLITTLAWGLNGEVSYALEGSIFVAGSALQWLRDDLRLIDTAYDTDYLASTTEDSAGCYFVPAFSGLGAPYWDQDARGAIVGLTRSVGKRELVRATLESIAYQSYDVLKVMQEDSGLSLDSLQVDGGASANDFLMQFQADLNQVPVVRPANIESTALGAATMAALGAGLVASLDDLKAQWQEDRTFFPQMAKSLRAEKLRGWHKAVERAKAWAKD